MAYTWVIDPSAAKLTITVTYSTIDFRSEKSVRFYKQI